MIELIERLLVGGASNLASYLAAHVLLCLLPAFFIAGAMTALIPKEIGHPISGSQHFQIHILPGCRSGRIGAGGLLLYDRAIVCRYL